jgi:hypothetical protein
MRRSVAKTCPTSFGDSPAEGSSSISTRGSVSSARAAASICRCPPDSVPASTPGRAARSGNISNIAAIRPARAGFGSSSAAISRFSRMLSRVKMFSVCGTKPSPRRTRSCGEAPVISAPSSRTVPPITGTSPITALISVDLPAPFGPRIASVSPAATPRLAPFTIGRSGS